MTLFVDTSVWSLALRRDSATDVAEVDALKQALQNEVSIFTTGLILQELLQGFNGPKASKEIITRFGNIPSITPDRDDHIAAADLRNLCRRSGIQAGTIDALFAQLCIHHDLTILTTDGDFKQMQRLEKRLRIWGGA